MTTVDWTNQKITWPDGTSTTFSGNIVCGGERLGPETDQQKLDDCLDAYRRATNDSAVTAVELEKDVGYLVDNGHLPDAQSDAKTITVTGDISVRVLHDRRVTTVEDNGTRVALVTFHDGGRRVISCADSIQCLVEAVGLPVPPPPSTKR